MGFSMTLWETARVVQPRRRLRCKERCHTRRRLRFLRSLPVRLSTCAVLPRVFFRDLIRELTCVDLIPDPFVGSGTIGSGLTDLFSREEYKAVNRNAETQPSGGKLLKQVADAVAHEIKPNERTDL